MKRFVVSENRAQSTLFPQKVDEYIGDDNPVRVIDVFVDEVDLRALGFDGVVPEETGRPAYHPATLLKIYIYGYLNRIQSSRRLEREAQRNLELIWLTGKLAPDFKTIADFRKDNGPAIRRVCSQFVLLCRQLKLFSEAMVAIDGSKFKADNNSDRSFSANKLKTHLKQLEDSVSRYLVELDRADRAPSLVPEERVAHIHRKIRTLKRQMQELREVEARLQAAPDKQVSLTDPDARCMSNRGRNTPIVGYNVQTAVDSKHHLIVAHEVTNLGHDRSQLSSMAKQAHAAMGTKKLTVLADRGYFGGEQVLECERQGITALVPKSLTSSNRKKGQFDKRDFEYFPKNDTYRCPAGKKAIWRFSAVEHGMTIHRYWSSDCPRCPMKARCTTGVYRRISRWEHEDVLDRMQNKLDRMPEASRLRKQTVEHPFATLKSWMGATHFLTRTLPKVSAEMSLHVLAYNLKRAIQILGPQELMRSMRV
jgi:transposase